MTKQEKKGAATAPKSKYAGVGATRAQRPANYFRPGGHFLIRVLKIEEGQDRFEVALVAMQGTVVHSFADSAPTTNKVGEDVSEIIKRTNKAYGPRLKALAMTVANLTEADFEEQEEDGEIIDEMVSEDQPAAGVILEVRSTQILKQTAAEKANPEPKDFYTRVDFIRRVSFSETRDLLLESGLTPELVARRVPNIDLEIENESKEEEAGSD